ncbi:MAG TPA: hypothetical protein VFV19_12100 [Candidatus Polarisedimenticolaceae bacterium]|nr:hypothetical protein [Candidatus Polarisedimenticolaceae bacterium]
MDGEPLIARRVAEYLLEHGWITPDQIDEARRTQSFFGGRLDSHLLRLGYVSEPVLGEALTDVAGVPYASWEHLRTATAEALEAIPLPLVERHRVCPFRLEQGRLRIATANPRDPVALREIQAAVGHTVEPWIAAEPRVYQALERHYRLKFESTRGIRLVPEQSPAHERSRPGAPSEEAPASPEPEVGLDGRPMDAQFEIDDFMPREAGDASETDPARHASRAAVARAPEPASLDGLDEALAAARDRDEIAEALFAFCGERATRCGLFAAGKDGIRGVAGRGRAFETEQLRAVTVPSGSGTVFDTALTSRDFYFGVVPALPANRDLYTALGGRLPATVLVLPIVVKERTVALFYLDADDAPMTRPDIPLMRRVAAKAGLAFELLLLRKKLREI